MTYEEWVALPDGQWTKHNQLGFERLGFELEVAIERDGNKRHRADVASEDFEYVIELKASRKDMYSKYGKNFVGMYNYLFTRPELTDLAIKVLESDGFDYVGVMTLGSDYEFHFPKRAKVHRNGIGYPRSLEDQWSKERRKR